MRQFGVHSAGSPALVGNTSLSLNLERKIGEFLGMDHVILFSTGWAAGYGVIKGLVRSAGTARDEEEPQPAGARDRGAPRRLATCARKGARS